MNFFKQLFRKRDLTELLEEAKTDSKLARVLDTKALTSIGIGAIIGTGIFVLVGEVAKEIAGPAIVLSFVVAGMLCVLAALCYAEFASMAPVEGSAYTYGYCTLGEFFAWIIAWDLILEYAVAASAVAHGWSHYLQNLLVLLNETTGGWVPTIPGRFGNSPIDYLKDAAGERTEVIGLTGNVVDLPAVIITLILSALLVKGIKESARFNSAMVILKVAIVLAVIGIGACYIDTANWKPFAPYGYGGVTFFGDMIWGTFNAAGKPVGVLAGAAIMFFAFVGFDGVSAHSAEAKDPERDVPKAILYSLLVCTALYLLVGGVLTGMVHYTKLDSDAPVSDAFGQVGLPWMQFVVAVGAIAGMTSVMLVMMLTQPRILLALARDGLLPQKPFGVVHPKFKTPWISTIMVGVFVAVLAGCLPLSILADLVSIGTLLAFAIVCAAVLIMRYVDPDAKRPFKTPFFPFVPIAGVLGCLLLMFSLPWENWLRLLVWLGLGMLIYFTYGFWKSKQRFKDKAAAGGEK